MKQPLVTPLDRDATPQAAKMADFYDETLVYPQQFIHHDAPPSYSRCLCRNESGSDGK